jgi:hypothetical protein
LKFAIFVIVGASTSGKSPDFGSGIRRFESYRPSQLNPAPRQGGWV